jgi:type IV pilus assembly protein PilA
MEGPVGSRRAGVVLTAVALALAGCGGDDDEGSDGGTDTQSEQSALSQDAQAKSDARNLVSYVEACYVDQMDYSACRDAAGGENVGEATVASADAATFTIVSPSESGNEFRIEKTKSGTLERTCETSGEGGCTADGSW